MCVVLIFTFCLSSLYFLFIIIEIVSHTFKEVRELCHNKSVVEVITVFKLPRKNA